ncbi:hypothetical protein AGMMS49944_05990 [Spirochaetia bacterium]|nr:hypothetical protein AGMMS49944_05990 [Spirochaetia bacterium]
MEFIVKKTNELTGAERQGMLALFNAIFEKDRPVTYFNNQFSNNPLGYSFHAMIVDAGQIVGSNSYIPAYYLVNGKRVLFVNSVDTMVSKPYRDFVNLYDMVTTAHDYMQKEGVAGVYGFPNDSSYFVYIKSKLMHDIGSLTTYCLPYRIGGIKPGLKALNWLSIFFVRLYVFLVSIIAGNTIYRFPIEKEAETYNATRYKRLDAQYRKITYKGSEFVYKIMEHEGIKSAFLIDVFEKSAANFNKAVQYIIKNHGKEFDILLYAGYLPFKLHGLIKVPQKLIPKNFHFTGEILRKDKIDSELFFTLASWDVNLSNYDLL